MADVIDNPINAEPLSNEEVNETAPQNRRKNNTTSKADRERILAAHENGADTTMISKTLGIKRGTVYAILKKYWKTGDIEAYVPKCTKIIKTPEHPCL